MLLKYIYKIKIIIIINTLRWSHKCFNVSWDFWKNIFLFLPVFKNFTNFCKDRRSSYKILLTMLAKLTKTWQLKKMKTKKKETENLKAFLAIRTENGMKYSYILWNSKFYHWQFYAYFITEKWILREIYVVDKWKR